MARRITSILVYHARSIVSSLTPVEVVPLGAAWDATPSNELFGHHLSYPEVHEVHGELPEMTISVMQSSDFIIKRLITQRTQLWVGYDDDSWIPWRVTSVTISAAGHSPAIIQTQAMWGDMNTSTFRYVRADIYNNVAYRLPIRKISFAAALGIIFDLDYGCPANMRLGTVDPAFDDVIVTLDANGSSHMELVANVCKAAAEYTGTTCEFDHTYVGGSPASPTSDLLIYWNFWVEAGWTEDEYLDGVAYPERRPIQEPGYGENNLFDLQIQDGENNLFTMVIPFGGRDETTRVGINGLEWDIAGMVWKPMPMETEITLVDDVIYYDDLYDANFSIVTNDPLFAYYDIVRVEAPNKIVVFGDVTLGAATKLRILSSRGAGKTGGIGTELTYVFDPVLEELLGRVELVVDFPDISPYKNIYEDSGESADMSDDAVDAGWVTDAGVTLSKVTDAAYVSYGTRATKMVFPTTGDQASSPQFLLEPIKISPQFSFWLAGRVTQGAVRISLVDAAGRNEPIGEEKVEFRNDEVGAIGAGGLLPREGNARLRFTALSDDTEMYLDAVTVTQSTGPWDYSADMGPKALYFAAVRYLKRESGITKQVQYDGDLFDAAILDEASDLIDEIVLGRWVRIQTFHEQQGPNTDIPVINFDARVTEITTTEDPDHARLQKRVSFDVKRLNVTRRFTFQTAIWPTRKFRPKYHRGVSPRESLLPLTPSQNVQAIFGSTGDTACVAIRSGSFVFNHVGSPGTPWIEEIVEIFPPFPVREGITVNRSVVISVVGTPSSGYNGSAFWVGDFLEIQGALARFSVFADVEPDPNSVTINWIAVETVNDILTDCIACWQRNRWYKLDAAYPCWEAVDNEIVFQDGYNKPEKTWEGFYHEGTEAIYLVELEAVFPTGPDAFLRICKYEVPKWQDGFVDGNRYEELNAFVDGSADYFGGPSGSAGHRSVLLGDYIYVFHRGLSASSGMKIFRYSITTDTWDIMTNAGLSMSGVVRRFGFVWTDGTDLFYAGGVPEFSTTPQATTFKIVVSGSTATWSDTGHSMATAVWQGGGVYDTIADIYYVFGGRDGPSNEVDIIQSYDGSAWATEPEVMPVEKDFMRAVESGVAGEFYVYVPDAATFNQIYYITPGSPNEYVWESAFGSKLNVLENQPFFPGEHKNAGFVAANRHDQNGKIIYVMQGEGGGNSTLGYSTLVRTTNPFTGEVSS